MPCPSARAPRPALWHKPVLYRLNAKDLCLCIVQSPGSAILGDLVPSECPDLRVCLGPPRRSSPVFRPKKELTHITGAAFTGINSPDAPNSPRRWVLLPQSR